jgi:hypothetical protein
MVGDGHHSIKTLVEEDNVNHDESETRKTAKDRSQRDSRDRQDEGTLGASEARRGEGGYDESQVETT